MSLSRETAPVDPAPAPEALARALQAAIDERLASFTLRQALRLPPVRRARDLIVSVGASFRPSVYVDGQAAPAPRIVERPDPWRSRHDFLGMTIDSLFCTGDAYWLLGEAFAGVPAWAVVLNPAEVLVRWDDRRFLPVYNWRGRDLVAGRDIRHLTIGQAAGQLHGSSPLADALPYLATLDAQERYAALFFGSGGVPTTVLKTSRNLTADEAKKLREQYATSRNEAQLRGEPAVASGGVELLFPGQDPQHGQLQESRDFATTVVARLLGIPAPLLLVAVAGSSLTYTNVSQVVHMLARQTILPLYLAPVEAALSDMLGERAMVRFSTDELLRADVGERVRVYRELVTMGVLDPAEVRAAEGWPVEGTPSTHGTGALAPIPPALAGDQLPPESEVPA